jgi:hypothetical protein
VGVTLALLFALVVLVSGWRSDLPATCSERGAGWPQLAESAEAELASTRRSLDGMQAQIDSLTEQVAILWEE